MVASLSACSSALDRRITVKWSVETPTGWRNIPKNNRILYTYNIYIYILICQTQQWMAHFAEEVMATMELRFFGELLQEEQEHCHFFGVTRDFSSYHALFSLRREMIIPTTEIHVGYEGITWIFWTPAAKKQDELLRFLQGFAQQVSSDPFPDH